MTTAQAPTPPVGQRLRELREEKGLRQDQIARLVGITQGTVSLIESGRRLPSERTLRAWARELGCDVEELLRARNAA